MSSRYGFCICIDKEFKSSLILVHTSRFVLKGNEKKCFFFSFTRRLIKSTFFLVALFGLQYILFAFVPVEVNGLIFKIWNSAELFLSSTQVNETEHQMSSE